MRPLDRTWPPPGSRLGDGATQKLYRKASGGERRRSQTDHRWAAAPSSASPDTGVLSRKPYSEHATACRCYCPDDRALAEPSKRRPHRRCHIGKHMAGHGKDLHGINALTAFDPDWELLSRNSLKH